MSEISILDLALVLLRLCALLLVGGLLYGLWAWIWTTVWKE